MPRQTGTRRTVPNLVNHLAWIADDSAMFSDGYPFRATFAAGDAKLAVVTGDNATGKSLAVRILAQRVRSTKALPITVSIRERTEAGMRRAFMFGDESDQSTGATSIKVVRAAIENNLDRPEGSVLILDEPEMGLSEGYAYALGCYIAEQVKSIPDVCGGIVVVTHSRPLVRGLDSISDAPSLLHTRAADNPIRFSSVSDWLANADQRSVAELLALPETGWNRWRTVQGLLHPKRQAPQDGE